MEGYELYKMWAPDDSIWTPWAKPTAFATPISTAGYTADEHPIRWIDRAVGGTAIVVDLPGQDSVEEGLSLARLGWRPVPLFNGVTIPERRLMQIDSFDLTAALFRSAKLLRAMMLPPDAPPAFLLDSTRTRFARRINGRFDNRWCVFPQDMPSAIFLFRHGVTRVIVRAERILDDLAHVLCRYREQNVTIAACTPGGSIEEFELRKPPKYKHPIYRFEKTTGMTRNRLGGFGGMVPIPPERPDAERFKGSQRF
ncbi:MAG: hypothetical protein LBC65_01185 [Oscillospiraceae bacterium]|jgi:hypothetical protein|nr:hypothetical protein [Oscillospiraceae bacterium]